MYPGIQNRLYKLRPGLTKTNDYIKKSDGVLTIDVQWNRHDMFWLPELIPGLVPVIYFFRFFLHPGRVKPV